MNYDKMVNIYLKIPHCLAKDYKDKNDEDSELILRIKNSINGIEISKNFFSDIDKNFVYDNVDLRLEDIDGIFNEMLDENLENEELVETINEFLPDGFYCEFSEEEGTLRIKYEVEYDEATQDERQFEENDNEDNQADELDEIYISFGALKELSSHPHFNLLLKCETKEEFEYLFKVMGDVVKKGNKIVMNRNN